MHEDRELIDALQSLRDTGLPEIPPLTRIHLYAAYHVENERRRKFRAIESAFVFVVLAIILAGLWMHPIGAEFVAAARIATIALAVAFGCRTWNSLMQSSQPKINGSRTDGALW